MKYLFIIAILAATSLRPPIKPCSNILLIKNYHNKKFVRSFYVTNSYWVTFVNNNNRDSFLVKIYYE